MSSGGSAADPAVDPARLAELERSLGGIRARVAAACRAVGRSADELTLIAVTKTFPAADVRLLAGLGIADVAENRDQEASVKAAACADLDPPLRWHFVGRLQRNKVRSVVRYADAVHSVDRPALVTALQAAVAVERPDRLLDVLLQVDLRDETGGDRGGARPGDLGRLADAVAAAPGLRLRGLMTVAPREVGADAAFAAAARCAERLRAEHPAASWLSAGMSGDFESAVRHGATHLRVGTALLGDRPPLAR
jgi:pyridoxal phosphate enzyme (YggS family)